MKDQKVTGGKKHFKNRGGCLCCPRSEDLLDMDTVLYNGFGGYEVFKDGKSFYEADPSVETDWNKEMKLKGIEKEAKKSPKSEWKVVLNSPLRGATWTRKGDKEWVLTETNQGFA